MTRNIGRVISGWKSFIIKKANHKLRKFRTKHIQATKLVIKDKQGPITISPLYCFSKCNVKKEVYTGYFTSLVNRFLSGSDYNAVHHRQGSKLITNKSWELAKCVDKNNLNI